MLTDFRWERVNLANFFDFARRTREYNQDKDEPASGEPVFDAGEIALTDGGLPLAFLSFLKRRGYQLSSQEQILLARLKRLLLGHSRQSVLCTPEWPPGTDPIKVSPRWIKGSFIYGVPVVQSKLTVPKYGTARRFMVQSGELQRLMTFIEKRIKLFDQHHKRLRKGHIERLFTNFDEDVSAEDLKLADSLAAKIAAEEATLAVAQQVDDTEHPTALPRDPDNIPTHEYRSNKRLIRWLKPDGYYNNGRYLMNNLRHDIMQIQDATQAILRPNAASCEYQQTATHRSLSSSSLFTRKCAYSEEHLPFHPHDHEAQQRKYSIIHAFAWDIYLSSASKSALDFSSGKVTCWTLATVWLATVMIPF
ncbi:hypothetical protein AB1N83_000018 [Pleurotus pulmonarius]